MGQILISVLLQKPANTCRLLYFKHNAKNTCSVQPAAFIYFNPLL